MDHWSIPSRPAPGGNGSSGRDPQAKGSVRERERGPRRRAGRKWAAYGVVVVVMTCALLWSALTPGLMLRLGGLLFGTLFLVLTIAMDRSD